MAIDKAPAFQFYAKDWLADTRECSPATKGILADCMALCWENGSVPADLAVLARATGATLADVTEAWPHLEAKTVRDPTQPGRLFYRRLEIERQKQADFRAEQAERGKAGAAARERNRKPEGSRNQAGASTAVKPAHERTHEPAPIPEGQPERSRNQALRSPISDLHSPISDPDRISEPPAGAGDPTATTPTPTPGPPAETTSAPPARAQALIAPPIPGEPLSLTAFEALWNNELRKVPADRYDRHGNDRWKALCVRIGGDAAHLSPPVSAVDYAKALMLALPAYIEHAPLIGETAPSLSVAAFEGWYATLAAWVAGVRPQAKPGRPNGIIGPMGPTVKHIEGRTPRKAWTPT